MKNSCRIDEGPYLCCVTEVRLLVLLHDGVYSTTFTREPQHCVPDDVAQIWEVVGFADISK